MATDQEIMSSNAGEGIFAKLSGGAFGAAARQKRQAIISRTLNEEIEREIGDSTNVNLQEVLPQAYFNAARRIASLGNADEAQKLYAAGVQAISSTATHAAELKKTYAEVNQLDEAPNEFLETTRQRDSLAAQAQKFPEGTPTGAALRKRVAELDERLKVLNERGTSTAALPREVVLAQQMTEQRRAAGNDTPVTVEDVWRTERDTSQRAQDYRNYVEGGGKEPYDKWIVKFESSRAAGSEGGKRMVTRLDEDEQEAIGAVTTIRSIDESLKLINEGVRTGAAAGARQFVARAAATFLGEDPSTATVNTDAYIASAAPRLVQIVRALAPVTEQDKDYINAAIAGQLNIGTPEAFRKMLEIAYRAARPKVERYNNRLAVLGEEYEEIANDFQPLTGVPELNFAPPAPAPVTGEPSIDDLVRQYAR